MALAFFWIFLILMAVGMPVVFALALAPGLSLWLDPLHFAIIMCVNVTVGLATPPMGLVLFVASSISGERVESIALEMAPFLAIEVGVIFLITFVPGLSMTLLRLLGFT